MPGRIVTFSLAMAAVGSVLAWAVIILPPGARSVIHDASTGRAEVAQSGRHESARFVGETGTWTVSGRFFGQGPKKFDVELRILDKFGRPATEDVEVRLDLAMPEHRMPPVETAVRRLGPGVYRAAGEVAMDGQWRARVTLPDGMIHVRLDIGS